MRIGVAVSPAILTLTLTLIISLATGHPAELFLARSITGISIRFTVVTVVLSAPILILPRLLALTGRIAKKETFFGQLVKSTVSTDGELGKLVGWVLRPLQGIGLALIVAERFLNFLEFSTGASSAIILARASLFLMGGALTSLFLSVIWALDDLGVKIYNGKTGEVRTAGSSIGTILPLITGAVGVSGLFHASLPVDALIDLLEIVIVLYPPYALFAIFHHEYVRRQRTVLPGKLALKKIETKVRWVN